MTSLSEWEFFHLLEGYLSDSLELRVAQVGEKLPSNCPRQAVKFVGQNYGRIFDAKQQAQLSFTNAAFHTINNVLNSMHHRGELQWQNAEDCYSFSKRVLKDLEKLYNIQTSAMVNDLEAKWPLVTKSEVAFAHQNRLMIVTKTVLSAFPFQDSSSKNGVLFSITVPEALIDVQEEIVEHLREVEEIKLLSADTSQKGTIVGKVASEKDIASILPEFTYRRQKHTVKLSRSFPLTLHPLHESKTVENVKMALKGMDVIPLKIHEPDRSTQTIVIEVSSQDDVNYIKEQGVTMKPQKLTVLEQPKPIPYVVYLAAPIKSLDSFKILWENHFQFLPDEIHTAADLCSAAFFMEEKHIPAIESKATSFRINGTKPVVVPYTPFRLKLGFSSPMEKAHLHTALGAITSNLSALSLHIPDFNDENSSTFFSAFLHSKEEGPHATFLSKEFTVSPYIPPPSSSTSASTVRTPLSPVINAPPQSPSKTTSTVSPGHSPISFSFYLPVIEGIAAPDVFSAFKAVGEEKGKGKGAWNILFVFDRDGTFYVDVWGDPSLVEEVKSVLIGGQQVPVHKVEGEVPYYLLQISNVSAALDKGKILNFFKNEKRRVGQISVKSGVAYVPMAQSDMQAYAKKKFIFIENVKLPVSESGGKPIKSPAAAQQVRKTVTVKPIEGNFLKKNKELLESIEADLSVTIRITMNRSQPQNTPQKEKGQGKDKEKKGEKGKDKDKTKGKDKPKEQKKKVDKGSIQSCTISVQGASAENVDQAIEEVKAVLSANTLKTIGLPFKDGGLMKFTLPKLSEALHEFDSFSLVYDVNSGDNKITVTLFGEQVVVEEVAASISALHREYAIDDSLKIPPTLNLDIAALEAEYEVRLYFNKQSGKLQILGTRDAIAQLKDNLNSQISNTHTVAQVKFAKEPFLFLQNFFFSDPKWQENLTKMGTEVAQRGNGIMTIKGKDQKIVQTVKQHLEKLRQSIQEKKVVKTTAKYLVGALEAYVKNQLEDVLIICKVLAAQTKNTTTPNDDDDSDNDDDDASSESSLSSTNSNSKQKTNSKEANVEIGAWYLRPLEGKVAQLLDSVVKKGVETVKIKYTAEDVATIKGLNLQALQEKHAVNIYNNVREKSFAVNGFDQSSVQQVCNTIKTLLDKSGNRVTTITIAHHLYNFLKWRRKELLQAIKQKHNLKRLELSCTPASQPATASAKKNANAPKDAFNVVLEGPPAGVTAAQVELRAIRVKHIKVDGAEDKLKALEQDLRKNYDLSAFTIKHASNSVLMVTAEANMDKWDEVNAKVAALNPKASKKEVKAKDPKAKAKEAKSDEQDLSKGYPVMYSPEKGDFKLLVNCTLRKKLVDLAEFKKTHGLLKKPFLDKRTSRITFTVTSQEQAEAAITAMVAVIAALKQTNFTEVVDEEEESSSDDEFGIDNDGLFAPMFMTTQFPSSSIFSHPMGGMGGMGFGGGISRAMQMHQQRRAQQSNIVAELFNLFR